MGTWTVEMLTSTGYWMPYQSGMDEAAAATMARRLSIATIGNYRARNTEPAPEVIHTLPYAAGSQTSKAAAESMQEHAGSIRERIDRWLIERGEEGATRAEIIAHFGSTMQTIGPRVIELLHEGKIYERGTRKTPSGRDAAVLYPNLDRRYFVNEYEGRKARQEREEHERQARETEMRLTLANFVAAYGNCDVQGALMVIAHKPPREIDGQMLTEHDAIEVAMMKTWLRACKVLGITPDYQRKGDG